MNGVVVNIQQLQVDQMALSLSKKVRTLQKYHPLLILEDMKHVDSSLTRIECVIFFTGETKTISCLRKNHF